MVLNALSSFTVGELEIGDVLFVASGIAFSDNAIFSVEKAQLSTMEFLSPLHSTKSVKNGAEG